MNNVKSSLMAATVFNTVADGMMLGIDVELVLAVIRRMEHEVEEQIVPAMDLISGVYGDFGSF